MYSDKSKPKRHRTVEPAAVPIAVESPGKSNSPQMTKVQPLVPSVEKKSISALTAQEVAKLVKNQKCECYDWMNCISLPNKPLTTVLNPDRISY